MKKLIIILLCYLPMLSFTQSQTGFEITAHLDGINDGETIRLIDRLHFDRFHPVYLDSAKVKNGTFHLKGKTSIASEFLSCIILISDQKFIGLVALNGEKINIKGGDINHLKGDLHDNVAIEGAVTDEAYTRLFRHITLRFYDQYNRNEKQISHIKDSIGYNYELVGQLLKQRSKIDSSCYRAVLEASKPAETLCLPSAIANLVIFENGYFHPSFLKPFSETLSDAARNTKSGKIVLRTGNIAIGQPMPDFTLADVDGQKVNLKKFAANSKLTLVHFWGPNSFTQEDYQKELRSFYSKYQEKGLKVIAVSADTSTDDWKIRVMIKKYPWVNVLAEPKGWGDGSLIQDLYGEGGHLSPNTTNVLLDDKGTIIAWDPAGVVLQYYLEKYLDRKVSN